MPKFVPFFFIMENEIWKDVPNYEGLYKVSNFGNVRSKDRKKWNGKVFYTQKGRLLKQHLDGRKNYLFVSLYKDGKDKQINVHRLVAMTFIPNPNNYPCINHKNEIKTDNRAENLEWCDSYYNMNYGTCMKRMIESRNRDNDMEEVKTKIKKKKRENNSLSCEKPVIQYTMSGEFVMHYNSATEAERQTGISRGGIQRCCIGKYKQAKGYIWKYDERRQYDD